jgi:hypothetical protein
VPTTFSEPSLDGLRADAVAAEVTTALADILWP